MANENRVSGLWPVKFLSGADWDGRGNVYCIPTTDTNVISVGDPVKLSGDGDTARGIPGALQATAGATCVGVVIAIGVNPGVGPYINPNALDLSQAPATKLVPYYALVVDDPNVIFEIQEAGAGSVLTSAALGENADFVAAAPAAGARLSGFYLNNNGHDTTITRNLKIHSLSRRVGNGLGQYAKWWVLINNHSYRAGTTGI